MSRLNTFIGRFVQLPLQCQRISTGAAFRHVSISAQYSKHSGRSFEGPNEVLNARRWEERRMLLDIQGRNAVEGRPMPEQLEAIRRIKACKSQGDWSKALEELSSIESPIHSHYATVLDVCVEALRCKEAERLWAEMPVSAHGPSRVSVYNMMLKLYRKKRRLDDSERLYAELLQAGHQPSIITYSEMIQTYGVHSAWENAIRFLAELQCTSLWSAATVRQKQVPFIGAMTACARKGLYIEARKIFDGMREENVPATHNAFNALLTACAQHLDSSTADGLLSEMRAYGLQPRAEDYTIRMACSRNDQPACEALFAELRQQGVEPNRLSFEAVAEAALHAGDKHRARELLAEARARSQMPPTKKSLRLEAEAAEDAQRIGPAGSRAVPEPEANLPMPSGWAATLCPSSGSTYYWKQNDPQGTVTWEDPRHSRMRM